MTQALIELSDLGFNWPGHPQLLDIPAFRLEPGETLFLKGPSGSGKTTLLGLLGGVQTPSRGSIRLLGQELTDLSAGARDRFRVDHTGYIFQQFNLLPGLKVRDNMLFQRRLNRMAEQDEWIDELIQVLELGPMLQRPVEVLSGGQAQRVAIARALAHKPRLLFADEPTGNLHDTLSQQIMALMMKLVTESGCSLLLVTHNRKMAAFTARRMLLETGHLQELE